MTREEQIFEVAERHSEFEYNQTTYSNGFIDGARWADNNHKSPWISVDDDLPCNHEELIDTTRHCTVSKDVIVRHKDGSVTFERMIKNYKSQWIFLGDVTHWMPIPELPKE